MGLEALGDQPLYHASPDEPEVRLGDVGGPYKAPPCTSRELIPDTLTRWEHPISREEGRKCLLSSELSE